MEKAQCDRCGGTWLSPDALDPAVKSEVASLVRVGNPILAIRRMRKATGLGLKDAKAIRLHVTREPGKCPWCGAILPNAIVVSCSRCRSLNYNW